MAQTQAAGTDKERVWGMRWMDGWMDGRRHRSSSRRSCRCRSPDRRCARVPNASCRSCDLLGIESVWGRRGRHEEGRGRKRAGVIGGALTILRSTPCSGLLRSLSLTLLLTPPPSHLSRVALRRLSAAAPHRTAAARRGSLFIPRRMRYTAPSNGRSPDFIRESSEFGPHVLRPRVGKLSRCAGHINIGGPTQSTPRLLCCSAAFHCHCAARAFSCCRVDLCTALR